MEIRAKSKYEVGDKVWVVLNKCPEEREIIAVVYYDSEGFHYNFKDNSENNYYYGEIKEERLSDTKLGAMRADLLYQIADVRESITNHSKALDAREKKLSKLEKELRELK